MPEPLHTVNDRLQFIAAHQSGNGVWPIYFSRLLLGRLYERAG